MAKLLLIDDDEDAMCWMSAALETDRHEVKAFRNGHDALVALETYTPDLIVADILMPEMDGLDFARIVRKYERLPLIFVSIAKKQAEAVLVGAVGYVSKPATASEVRAAVERALGQSTRRRSILVVDDEEDILELYRSFLEPHFEVFTARDGRDALEVLRANPVDLAIVDVHMPLMNGAELIRAMRKDPSLATLPVVVQTTDRTALRAPVWGTLHVSEVLDKSNFLKWFESHVGEVPAAR
jgi:CheY-like chemotaxis protein